MPRIFNLAAVAVVMLAVAATTVAAQTGQRFSDVPPEHEAFAAIEWAATAGVTTGYDDGTFKSEVPLSKRHAVVFMERYYDQILGAEESQDFTRGDMMRVLHLMAGAATTEEPTPTTATTCPTDGTLCFIDHYWSADGNTYYVVIGDIDGFTYCEVHMTLNGRRTGEWGNEWWRDNRSQVIVAVSYIEYDADGFEAECR